MDNACASLTLRVGGLSRPDLLAELAAVRVQLNDSARALLDDPCFDDTTSENIRVVERAVRDLDLTKGAALSRILLAAQDFGLLLCPPITAPYLRLATLQQESATDSVLTNGYAPSGSITVAASPLRNDDDYPKGFYLRVIDDVPWLRGYRCSDRHIWSPDDCFAFRSPD